jgi:uncharacterized protein (DUF2225 family)
MEDTLMVPSVLYCPTCCGLAVASEVRGVSTQQSRTRGTRRAGLSHLRSSSNSTDDSARTTLTHGLTMYHAGNR